MTLQGRNVSGRNWKNSEKRASSIRKNITPKSWQRKQAEQLIQQETIELQKQLAEEKRQAIIAKNERRLENEKRKQENELKAMERNMQQLNTAKLSSTLKAMSKKQLRQIKKTRINTKTGVKEYVSAYSKA